jgi:hypothetical protein
MHAPIMPARAGIASGARSSSPTARHADLPDMTRHPSLPWPWPILVLLAAACGADADLGAAQATLAAFQQALRAGDEAACRELLTRESAPVLAEMPWQQVRTRPALAIGPAHAEAAGFHVEVRDPAAGGRRSQFVVVREYGRLVVDLVATAGLHTEVVEASGAREEFVPRELTPTDLDRIRQHELAQPRR